VQAPAIGSYGGAYAPQYGGQQQPQQQYQQPQYQPPQYDDQAQYGTQQYSGQHSSHGQHSSYGPPPTDQHAAQPVYSQPAYGQPQPVQQGYDSSYATTPQSYPAAQGYQVVA
jgi:hypothetical protein